MNEYNGINEALTDNKKIKEMIVNNPDLPLIFLCSEECWGGESGYEVNFGKAEIEEFALYDERLVDRDSLEEALFDDMWGNVILTDEEYSKLVQEELSKYEFRKAITIRLG